MFSRAHPAKPYQTAVVLVFLPSKLLTTKELIEKGRLSSLFFSPFKNTGCNGFRIFGTCKNFFFFFFFGGGGGVKL